MEDIVTSIGSERLEYCVGVGGMGGVTNMRVGGWADGHRVEMFQRLTNMSTMRRVWMLKWMCRGL